MCAVMRGLTVPHIDEGAHTAPREAAPKGLVRPAHLFPASSTVSAIIVLHFSSV